MSEIISYETINGEVQSQGVINGEITSGANLEGIMVAPWCILNSDKHYVYKQMTASAVWTVTHNLNKYPAVSVVDSAGTVVVGEVEYVDANTLTITFTSQFAGKAYCN